MVQQKKIQSNFAEYKLLGTTNDLAGKKLILFDKYDKNITAKINVKGGRSM